MKQFSFFLATAMLMAPAALRAQDAAVEERLNKLSAQIEDLIVAKDAQNKRIEELARAVREFQDQQQNKPTANYASQDDLKKLAASLDKVDQSRRSDYETVVKSLEELRKVLTNAAKPAAVKPPVSSESGGDAAPQGSEKGYWHVIKSGDTISAVAKAYSEQGIKVTTDDILKANPGLKPESLAVGKKIWIPAPKQ